MIIIVIALILSPFIFGFVAIKGVPIPIIYNMAGEEPVEESHSVIVVDNTTTNVIKTVQTTIPTTIQTAVPVTPIPDPTLPLGEYRNIHRSNVSGYKYLDLYQTIYDYKTLDHYLWYSHNTGKAYAEYAPSGYEYAFVFPHIYSVNESDRIWIPDASMYHLYVDGNEIQHDNIYQPDIPITEFENTYTLNDDERVKPYGYHWEYQPNANTTSRAMMNAGWVAIPDTFLRSGKSNAEDGYIIYLKPKKESDDIQVCTVLLNEPACWRINQR